VQLGPWLPATFEGLVVYAGMLLEWAEAVIQGDADALVPIAHGRRLAARYRVGVWTWFGPGAAHVGAYAADPSLYLGRVDGFLEGTLGTPV
jgi:hypothetical protein